MKCLVFCALALLLTTPARSDETPASQNLPCATPESQGVSSRAILDWIDANEKEIDALHGFVILRHGKEIARGTWAPYDTIHVPHMLYSHSKSFTSTAIGFLVDDGKLDLDERLVDLFPDKTPPNPSDNLKSLRVRDLLTMNVGADRTDPNSADRGGDWERLFMFNAHPRKPGTGFRYDSSATYMLSAIVERKSGKDLMAFLDERLFSEIGIASAWSTTSPSGTPCGGWGMHMTTPELSRFGQFLLNEGTWNGKRILSAEWIRLATARQTWSGPIGVTGQKGGDWAQGYGFQFWRCRHDAYRADGADGQFTIVLPAQDCVVALHAGCRTTQKELDVVWERLLPALADKPLPEDPAAVQALRQRCAGLRLPPPRYTAGQDVAAFDGIACTFADNPRGVKSIRLEKGADGRRAILETRAGMQTIPYGAGGWRTGGTLEMDPEKYEALGMYVGKRPTGAAAGVEANGDLHLRIHVLDAPGRLDFFFTRTNGAVRASADLRIMGGCKLAPRTAAGAAR